jgi:ribosomal protein L2
MILYKPLFKTAPKSFTNFKYTLFKKGVTSGGSRLSYQFKRFLPILIKTKKLTTSVINKAGRNASGRIVMFSKRSVNFKKKFNSINFKFRLRAISFIASINIVPHTHNIISLIFSSTGSISYIPTNFSHTLFSLTRMYKLNTNILKLRNRLFLESRFSFITQSIFLVKQLPRNQKICLLELIPGDGIKYIRSPGTSGHLLKLDVKLNTAFVRLPSRVRKVFSFFSLGSPGVTPFSDNKY